MIIVGERLVWTWIGRCSCRRPGANTNTNDDINNNNNDNDSSYNNNNNNSCNTNISSYGHGSDAAHAVVLARAGARISEAQILKFT